MIEQLRHVRRQQLEQFEKLTQLETRLLCRCLPASINDLDRRIIISPNDNQQHAKQQSLYQTMKKQQTTIRDLKRSMILDLMADYEQKIEEFEYLYQQIFVDIEQCSTSVSIDLIYHYLQQTTWNQMKRIRYDERIFDYRLRRPKHRRSSTTMKNNSISIYPEAIIEIFEVIFNRRELDFLSSMGTIV